MNTRLAVATHILTFIETQGRSPSTSELVASSVNTNPALIRRLLSQLAKAGLTTSQMGSGGGTLLAKPADRITMLDVYRALEDEPGVFALHPEPNPQCPVGRNINAVLHNRIGAAERAMQAELATVTIADMVRDVAAEDRKRG